MAHTPGPWTILPNRVCVIGPCAEDEGGSALVAMCAAARRDNDECAANARLIAAAPELLAALEELLAFSADVVSSPNTTLGRLHNAAEAAVARAKGV